VNLTYIQPFPRYIPGTPLSGVNRLIKLSNHAVQYNRHFAGGAAGMMRGILNLKIHSEKMYSAGND